MGRKSEEIAGFFRFGSIEQQSRNLHHKNCHFIRGNGGIEKVNNFFTMKIAQNYGEGFKEKCYTPQRGRKKAKKVVKVFRKG